MEKDALGDLREPVACAISAHALAAIVLAAGQGTRLGGPKALLEFDGVTLVARHVARALACGCERVVLVVRAEVAEKIDAGARPEVRVVISDAPDPAGSLAVGVAALGACARVFVTPVDTLPASDETCAALVAALDAGARAATPAYRDRGGHPVLCRFDVLEPYARRAAALDPPESSWPPLRTVLRALGPERARVEVRDPQIAVDLDTPDDWLRLTGAAPAFAARVVLSPDTPLRLKYPR